MCVRETQKEASNASGAVTPERARRLIRRRVEGGPIQALVVAAGCLGDQPLRRRQRTLEKSRVSVGEVQIQQRVADAGRAVRVSEVGVTAKILEARRDDPTSLSVCDAIALPDEVVAGGHR